jgi:Zn-dependent protease
MFNIDPVQLISILLILLVSITFHEFSHAWSATELGDDLPRRMGRLTLNPIAHLDPVGTLMMVFTAISGWGIGWGKPVVVDPRNMRGDPRVSMGLTSAAGPFSNLILATLAAIPLRLGLSMPDLLTSFLLFAVFINVGLMLFNLIPLPPLDGFSVIQGILATFRTRWAYEWGNKLDRLAPYGPMLLMVLLALGWFTFIDPLGWLMNGPAQAISSLLLGW